MTATILTSIIFLMVATVLVLMIVTTTRTGAWLDLAKANSERILKMEVNVAEINGKLSVLVSRKETNTSNNEKPER